MSENRIDLSQNPSPPPPVPAEAVPLPSQGKVYPAGSPLHGAELVEIRAMTARDEDILTSRALIKQGKAIDTLLRSCILSRGFDPDDMLVGDRNAVLIGIRVTGYGAEYKVQITCPKCEGKFQHEFDLSNLAIKRLAADPLQPGSNAFEFTLPQSKRKVVFKLPTGRDQQELSQTLDAMRKKLGLETESVVTTTLHNQILSLDGETDRGKLGNLVRSMSARDARALRGHMDKIAPGVDMKQKFTCVECGEEAETEVPLGVEFFWPSGE